MATIHGNLFNVPQPQEPINLAPAGQRIVHLPLHLISLIVSHIDNVADIARCCRASRVLNYMALPQLYKHITLCSYDTIRYKDDVPEGFGSASPFSMGLNALVTRNVAVLVKSLALQGFWNEHDLHQASSAGRVPDDAMMLNIAVRAAVDRCTGLESFRWDMNTKLLSNVYAGLINLQHLTDLRIRFPSNPSPRPVNTIPGMPHLRSLTVTYIDPLCYPDDISTLICESKKLEALKLHWSPRMRDAGEPSVHLQSYFRRSIATKQKLRLRNIGFYNLYAAVDPTVEEIVDHSFTETVTLLNCFGTDDEVGRQIRPMQSFLDSTWNHPPEGLLYIKSLRHDRLNKLTVAQIGAASGLERLYLISARHVPNSQQGPSTPFSTYTPSNTTPASCARPSLPSGVTLTPNLALRNAFIEAIISNHGDTLRHLVLPDHWPLPEKLSARLFCACPNLTQLALALEFGFFTGIRMLLPFLKQIRAIRCLVPTNGTEAEEGTLLKIVEKDDETHEKHLGRELAGDNFPYLKWVGLGWKAWEVGGNVKETVPNEDGTGEVEVVRRRVKRVGLDAVREVEIWKMDSLDVV